jgi:hypothetical protein
VVTKPISWEQLADNIKRLTRMEAAPRNTPEHAGRLLH